MTHENQLLGARSRFERGPRRAARRISRIFSSTNAGTKYVGQSAAAELRGCRQNYRPVVLDRLKGNDGARPALSAGVTWWRAVTATASGLTVKVARLAARGEAGSSGFLLAAASWIAAEVLEGYAAFAQAMYPIALEPPDRLDPADEHKSDTEESRRVQIIVLHGDYCA